MIWTPPKKLDPRVIALARLLFLEMWKASFHNRQVSDEWRPETAYTLCVKTATIVLMIEESDAVSDPLGEAETKNHNDALTDAMGDHGQG